MTPSSQEKVKQNTLKIHFGGSYHNKEFSNQNDITQEGNSFLILRFLVVFCSLSLFHSNVPTAGECIFKKVYSLNGIYKYTPRILIIYILNADFKQHFSENVSSWGTQTQVHKEILRDSKTHLDEKGPAPLITRIYSTYLQS